MTLNKEYITQLYDEIGVDTREELGINSLEDFIDYIKATITSNLQYDLDLEVERNYFKTTKYQRPMI